jgi:hypothetical protein
MKALFRWLFLWIPLVLLGQTPTLSKDAKISVLTCGRGSELYTTFGHTALRVQDTIQNLDIVYNYGMFDFQTPNFYLKFVKGDLQYFVAAYAFPDFLMEYQMSEREVVEQTLRLTPEQVNSLFTVLNQSLYSDERYYTYKFIDRNCTTMVYEKINAVLGKPLLKKVDDTSISYRKLLYPYFNDHFYFQLGINILFGAKTDGAATQMFLPIELMHSLNQAKINGKPIVVEEKKWVEGQPKTIAFSFWNSIFVVILFLAAVLMSRRAWIYNVYWFLTGGLGIFLVLIGLYSDHKEVLWNYNALLFNPLYVALPFVRSLKALVRCIGIGLVALGIYAVLLFNKPHLLLMLPFVIAHVLLLRIRLQQIRKKSLPAVE